LKIDDWRLIIDDWLLFSIFSLDELVKSQQTDGTVKSSRWKARASFKAVRRNLEE
jgi:hypothetical protein